MKMSFAAGLGLALALTTANGTEAIPPRANLDADRIVWKTLRFAAAGLLGRVEAEVELAPVSAAAFASSLVETSRGEALPAPRQGGFILTVTTRIKPIIGKDRTTKSKVWFASEDGRALQLIKSRSGDKLYQAVYRFTASGAYRLKTRPRDAREEKLGAEGWTKTRESFYPYRPAQAGCRAVTEPEVLFFLVSASPLTGGSGPGGLCVFSDKALYQLGLRAERFDRLEVDYAQTASPPRERASGAIAALRVATQAGLTEGARPDRDLKFLGLDGDLEIFVERQTRIPVQVSGSLSPLGRIDIKLTEVVWKTDADALSMVE